MSKCIGVCAGAFGLVTLVGLNGPALAAGAPAASFEELAADAEPVSDAMALADLLGPLFPESCDSKDPLAYRQCEGARAFLESELRKKTYIAVGDAASVSVSPYDASQKQVDVEVDGCIACLRPVKLPDGKGGEAMRFFTTKAPRAIKNGKAVGLEVNTVSLSMPTPEREARWKKQEKKIVPRLRTQFVFKLGPVWTSGSFSGVSFVPLAYRVLDACSGEVVTTVPAPADGKGAAVKTPIAIASGEALRCPAPGQDLTAEERAAQEEFARLPPRLTREAIEQGMSNVQDRIHDCRVEFEESGTVNVRIVVEGTTGKVTDAQVLPPFDKSGAGLCVKAAVRAAKFGKFKAETQEVKIPVSLH